MATHRFLLLLSATFAIPMEEKAACFSNGGGCATCCPACAIHNDKVVSRASESRETVREDCFGEGEDRVCHKEPERLVFDFRDDDECVCVSTDVEMTDIELRLTDGSDCLNVRGHHLDVLACVEINHWFEGPPPNFRTLHLGQIEVDSADFWTNRLLSSSSRSTAENIASKRSHTRTLKSG